MAKELNRTVQINASPESVWSALTDPVKIKEYMFGADTETDWQPGSDLNYHVEHEGKRMLVVKGMVHQVEEPRYLEYSIFPTTSEIEDKPENYLVTECTVSEMGNGCELHIRQHDFSAIANGESRYEEAAKGWDAMLGKLKEVAERG